MPSKEPTRDKVLSLLAQRLTQKAIAKKLGISRSAVSKHLLKMERKGIIKGYGKTLNRYYEKVDNSLRSEVRAGGIKGGVKLPFDTPKETSQTSYRYATPSKLKLRLHRLQRTYALLSHKPITGLKELDLNNNKQYLGKGFRITTRHLEIEGLELYAERETPIAILEAIAVSLADNMAKSLAEEYGLDIAPQGHTPPLLTEIELTEHEMAERVEQRGIIELYKDKQGYKVWMDKSLGLGGLESNKVAYIQKLTDMTNDIVDNDAWNLMKANQLEMSRLMLEYGQRLNAHIPVLELAEQIMSGKTAKPRALRKALEDVRQSKLRKE